MLLRINGAFVRVQPIPHSRITDLLLLYRTENSSSNLQMSSLLFDGFRKQTSDRINEKERKDTKKLHLQRLYSTDNKCTSFSNLMIAMLRQCKRTPLPARLMTSLKLSKHPPHTRKYTVLKFKKITRSLEIPRNPLTARKRLFNSEIKLFVVYLKKKNKDV
ncbi:uncharacterized protein LOC126864037 [Bombus huntii]|uniref:uncharacterized protein LOC126864037 n=1 Tax=Bombus huntii TaxID=85661 RepID=UPI0021AA4202|nr:uncharacterized protein LOC126864037 [Bombus huntii]